MRKWLIIITIAILLLLVIAFFLQGRGAVFVRSMILGVSQSLKFNTDAENSSIDGTSSPASRYADLADRVSLLEENNALRELLEFRKRIKHRIITANVLYRDAVAPSYFYIDMGSDEGIREGHAVTTPDGILLGVVASTQKTMAQVQRLTAPSSNLAARLLHSSSTIGLMRGTAGPLLSFELIPVGIEILKDDLVVSSNADAGIPDGLLIGTVQSTGMTADALFQTASIEPLFASERLPTLVSIIIAG